jgi:hypothetical protein
MNVEIGAEAAQFPEKEYINGIAVAVYTPNEFYMLYVDNKPIVPICKLQISFVDVWINEKVLT